ncbi:MAG: M1 family metallopeptidase [Bacteroidetes bacterium]|nr:M1 family metallopeptidase [Bacteroidota bacterium]
MKILFTCLLFLIASVSFSQEKNAPERVRTYDVQHIKMNINLDWDKKMVIGNVETRIVPLADGFKEFEVDAVAFRINKITDKEGNRLKYDYDDKKITVIFDKAYSPNDTIVYTVDYTCVPQSGLYFIYPQELTPSYKNQVWSQGEGEDNRYWLPIYDYPNDKTTTEMYVTVENKYQTLSNGYLESKTSAGDDKYTAHWIQDKPHSTYLIMLGVGEYNIVEDNWNGIPVQSFIYPDKQKEGQFSFRNTAEMVKVFSEKYGVVYPWAKYAQITVKDFIYGGMENTSATVLNERAYYWPEIEKNYSAEGLISHELGHQWWGDLITCRNWNEMWLNESFATYSDALWCELKYGRDEYDYQILRNGDNALNFDETKGRYPIWAGYGSVGTNIYDKGSVIINTFRYILGDKFFPSLQTFLTDYGYKNVESKDLLDAINKTWNSNPNLDQPPADFKWMFDQWIWKAGQPEFDISYSYDAANKLVLLNVFQTQKEDSLTPVFRTPVEVRIKSGSEDKIEKINISKKQEQLKITFGSVPDFVQFDYGNNILDKSKITRSIGDIYNQILQSENAIDRIMAIRELPAKPFDRMITDVLYNVLTTDKFYGVRNEAAIALGKFKKNQVADVLMKAYDIQSHPKVKREILKALANFKEEKVEKFITRKIKDEKDDYIVSDGIDALVKVCNPEDIYEYVKPFMKRESHRNVVMGSVINALKISHKYKSDERIKTYFKEIAFGIDIPSRLRVDAIHALKSFAKDEDVKILAKKYIGFNARYVKQELIALLGESQDKSYVEFLTEIKKNTSDQRIYKSLSEAIKKLNGN